MRILLSLTLGSQARAWFMDPVREGDRSPVAVVLTRDGKQLLTVNQTSATGSLLERATGEVLTEVPVGKRPTAFALRPRGDPRRRRRELERRPDVDLGTRMVVCTFAVPGGEGELRPVPRRCELHRWCGPRR